MVRTVLTDAQWSLMGPHCLGKPGDPGRSGVDNRRFLEAVLWKARTNCPWESAHELPMARLTGAAWRMEHSVPAVQ